MGMEQCPSCKKIFNRVTGSALCPDCINREESDFEKVKAFVVNCERNNERSTITVTSAATGVSIRRILKYVREGLLDYVKGFDLEGMLRCAVCNKEIASGTTCYDCKLKMGLDSPPQIHAEPINHESHVTMYSRDNS